MKLMLLHIDMRMRIREVKPHNNVERNDCSSLDRPFKKLEQYNIIFIFNN